MIEFKIIELMCNICRVNGRMGDRGGCRSFNEVSHGDYTAKIEFIDTNMIITGMHR
jgi:hypothetical protein